MSDDDSAAGGGGSDDPAGASDPDSGAGPGDGDSPVQVRVRGIYATALTCLFLGAGFAVADPSGAIADRFDAGVGAGDADGADGHDGAGDDGAGAGGDADADGRGDGGAGFVATPTVSVASTREDLGVGVVGAPAGVAAVADAARVGVDGLSWADPAPAGAVYEATVGESLGGGAVVELGEREGYLPYDAVDGYVEAGDRVRVQVRDPRPPWDDGRPELTGEVAVGSGPGPGGEGDPVTLRRGADGVDAGAGLGEERATELVRTTDLLGSADAVPDGWGIRWERAAADAGMDALEAALDRAAARARDVEEALAAADGDGTGADGDRPRRLAAPAATRWVRFGRDSRFELDDHRRRVVPTMVGHHRTKAATPRASDAVDLVEAVCSVPGPRDGGEAGAGDGTGGEAGAGDGAGGDGDDGDGAGSENGTGDGDDGDRESDADPDDFQFGAVAGVFGPSVGDRVGIAHGKPDGRAFTLGRAEVRDLTASGNVTLRREMSGGGEYDALGTPIEPGDVAVTRVEEGRWWYPTAYRGADGRRKGTYVNVCTPVEVFPDAVRYVDLHVDVVRHPDGTTERVDDDELDAAVAAGDVPEALARRARSVATRLEDAL